MGNKPDDGAVCVCPCQISLAPEVMSFMDLLVF